MAWTSDGYDEEKSIQLPTTRLMVLLLGQCWPVEEDEEEAKRFCIEISVNVLRGQSLTFR